MGTTRNDKPCRADKFEALQRRLEEAEQTLDALTSGHVDAIAVQSADGARIFTLQGAETAYRLMVETMNEGAMTLDPDGVVLYANPRLCGMLGMPYSALVGKNIRDVIPSEEHAAFSRFIWTTQQGENVHHDFTFVGASQNHVPVYLSSAPLEIAERHDLCVIVTDLTERKTAERELTTLNNELEHKVRQRTEELLRRQKELERINAELLSSEERFRELADAMPQLVWTATPDGNVDYYNRRRLEFNGIGQTNAKWEWTPVIHPDDLERTVEAWSTSVRTGQTYQIEHRVRKSDGAYYWHLSRGFPIHDEQGRIIKWYGTATNIDSTKKAQEQLAESENKLRLLNENLETLVVQRTEQVRALSKALTVAEQRERVRFSQVLHDDLQQMLLSAKMQLDIISDLGGSPEENAADLGAVRDLLARAVSAARSLALELNPPILKSEGLDAALNWLSHHMEQTYGLIICIDIPADIAQIDDNDRVLLVHIARELLFNVMKHAQTREVVIGGRRSGPLLFITVEDRGVGFDPNELKQREIQRRGLGIFSINERLSLFGGRLDIQSHPGKGTKATIVLPYHPRQGVK